MFSVTIKVNSNACTIRNFSKEINMRLHMKKRTEDGENKKSMLGRYNTGEHDG